MKMKVRSEPSHISLKNISNKTQQKRLFQKEAKISFQFSPFGASKGREVA